MNGGTLPPALLRVQKPHIDVRAQGELFYGAQAKRPAGTAAVGRDAAMVCLTGYLPPAMAPTHTEERKGDLTPTSEQ